MFMYARIDACAVPGSPGSNVSTTLPDIDIVFTSVDFIWLSAVQPAPKEDVSQPVYQH
jgi:hypothetical protein